jgi:hypothetical protein
MSDSQLLYTIQQMFSKQSEQLWTALVSSVQVYRISQSLRTVLQDLIAEVIHSQKCFIGLHIGPTNLTVAVCSAVLTNIC